MRRKEKEIQSRSQIDQIINECQTCRIGMADNNRPYILPMSFGYDGRNFYFHSAREGRKIDILRQNPAVCLEFDITDQMVRGEQACSWGIHFRSVIVEGTAEFIEDSDQKAEALGILMNQYSEKQHTFNPEVLKNTTVFRVIPATVSGKKSG